MSKNQKFTKEDEHRLFSSFPFLGGFELPDEPPPPFPFSQEEYQERLNRIRALMADAQIDLLYVTAPDSMCYYHGYRARWYRGHSPTVWPPLVGTAIHVDHDTMIHFDFPMENVLLEATSISKDRRFMPGDERLETGIAFIVKELQAEGWLKGTVGMEYWSHLPNRAVSEELEKAFLDGGCTDAVDVSRMVRAARRVKSPQEIVYMEEAARICDIGFRAVADVLRPGVTELEVYAETLRAMAQAGGETSGIIGNVSSGPYRAGHALNSRRIIQDGDIVTLDLCGVYNCYHGNAARAYYMGDPPQELVKLYQLSGASYEFFGRTARAGASIPDVCRTLQQYYEEMGIWHLRGWVGGYELGISFPPDWVGEFVFTVEEETEGTFLENEVTNYESILCTTLVDTFVYEPERARRLCSIPTELLVIG